MRISETMRTRSGGSHLSDTLNECILLFNKYRSNPNFSLAGRPLHLTEKTAGLTSRVGGFSMRSLSFHCVMIVNRILIALSLQMASPSCGKFDYHRSSIL